ncbi:hypothetical protein CSC03_2872 [Enterobacter hormaechei]|jgi:hypothetical protein|nr:hypothetical protein CSC19_3265 [Enterobacter hormaechei]AWZ96077.1 hypothetical protein CSB67_0772 [Enterobacter hormaechei]KAF0682103.1 hypothetical protein Y59_02280 [Enterobacter hormaechei]PRW23004.1 hypothetical protein CSC03_2872 [Enterobacter hormaechei]
MFPGVARQSEHKKQRTRSISKNNRYPFFAFCFSGGTDEKMV